MVLHVVEDNRDLDFQIHPLLSEGGAGKFMLFVGFSDEKERGFHSYQGIYPSTSSAISNGRFLLGNEQGWFRVVDYKTLDIVAEHDQTEPKEVVIH